MRMTDSCPWGICSFVRMSTITPGRGLAGRSYRSSDDLLRSAERRLGVEMTMAIDGPGDTWRHAPAGRRYSNEDVLVRLPGDVIARLVPMTGPSAERRRNVGLIRTHMESWLQGGISGGRRSPTMTGHGIETVTARLLVRAGVKPERVESLLPVSHFLDARLRDGMKLNLMHSETYGCSGKIDVAEGITWSGKALTVRGLDLPTTIVGTLRGEPLRRVLDIPEFDDVMIERITVRPGSVSFFAGIDGD